MKIFDRERALIGDEALTKLNNSYVAIFGIGGVGGYVAEMLCRAGIGKIDLFDMDTVEETNINRQIVALNSTIGRAKVDVMKERMLDINPSIIVNNYKVFYLPECADKYPLAKYDYIVDAIDNVTAKIELITRAKKDNIKIISAMGSGGKLNADFKVTTIEKTTECPLAKVMRHELKKRNIEGVNVVYSTEPKIKTNVDFISSISYVPACMGIKMSEKVIKDLIEL